MNEIIIAIYLTLVFVINIWAINFLYIFLRFLILYLRKGRLRFDFPVNYYPMVTIQVPIYNERPDMIRMVLESIYHQNYPKDKIEILILDQSDNNEIIDALKNLVADFKQKSLMQVSLIFVDRYGNPSDTSTQFKAGSLNYATKISHGEVFIIVDGDNYLDSNFLSRIIPHFSRKEIGLVLPRIVVHRRHRDIFARWVRITAHTYFIRNFIESTVGIPMGFAGAGAALRREVAEQFPWDTQMEDSCMGYYATTIKKWRMWFENNAVIYDEGIPYSLKDAKHRWARLVHGQFQIIKKMMHDTENRRSFFSNPQIIIKVMINPFLPFVIISLPFLMFPIYYFNVSFEAWIGLTLSILTLLGSIATFFLVYMVIKYGGISDLLYYPLIPIIVIVCLVPGVVALLNALRGKQRPFYRVQRHSKNIPKTEFMVQVIEAGLALFSFLAIIYFFTNPSAIYFYATYLVIMIASFSNFSIPSRKGLAELVETEKFTI